MGWIIRLDDQDFEQKDRLQSVQTHLIIGCHLVRLWPDSHLLSGPFWVPPGLFAKKWILLDVDVVKTPVRTLVISYKTADGTTYVAPLRLQGLSRLRHRRNVR